jgi:hypothetical protein
VVFTSHKNLKPPEAGGQRVAACLQFRVSKRPRARERPEVSASTQYTAGVGLTYILRRIFVFPNL